MSIPILGGPANFECPNCTSTLSLPQTPTKPVLHPCRGLKGLLAPMVSAGTPCKVEAIQRDDYIGKDIPHYDGEGRPIMSVVTTRDDGTDCQVMVPTATARLEDIR